MAEGSRHDIHGIVALQHLASVVVPLLEMPINEGLPKIILSVDVKHKGLEEVKAELGIRMVGGIPCLGELLRDEVGLDVISARVFCRLTQPLFYVLPAVFVLLSCRRIIDEDQDEDHEM